MAKLTGTNPDQVPTNADLGDMAYQSKDNASISKIGASPLHIQNGTVDYSWTPNVRTAAIVEGDNSNGTVLSIVSSSTGYSGIFFGDEASEAAGQLKFDHSANKYVITPDGGFSQVQIYSGGKVDIGSGLLELDGNDIGGTQVTIADDAVASITPPRTGGFMFVTASVTDREYPQQSRSGMVFFDVGGSLEIQERITATALDISTSDITGTTGTDGNVTVAVQSGVIKIENRGGSTHVFDITFL